MSFETLRVRWEGPACFITLNRPHAGNAINSTLLGELRQVMAQCQAEATLVVLEGSREVFCIGADLEEIARTDTSYKELERHAEAIYDLWQAMSMAPFLTICRVRGKVNAGGIGFVAASDVVIADDSASFCLSELLFGVLPACVLPFLARRVGWQRAHYMTVSTQTIGAVEAHKWGLVDVLDEYDGPAVRKHLGRIRRLSKAAIERYRRYAGTLGGSITATRGAAVAANAEAFSDSDNRRAIGRYVQTGRFPWEG
jgi:polyketide biosynthesis enoyl-CoA hydratase PksH